MTYLFSMKMQQQQQQQHQRRRRRLQEEALQKSTYLFQQQQRQRQLAAMNVAMSSSLPSSPYLPTPDMNQFGLQISPPPPPNAISSDGFDDNLSSSTHVMKKSSHYVSPVLSPQTMTRPPNDSLSIEEVEDETTNQSDVIPNDADTDINANVDAVSAAAGGLMALQHACLGEEEKREEQQQQSRSSELQTDTITTSSNDDDDDEDSDEDNLPENNNSGILNDEQQQQQHQQQRYMDTHLTTAAWVQALQQGYGQVGTGANTAYNHIQYRRDYCNYYGRQLRHQVPMPAQSYHGLPSLSSLSSSSLPYCNNLTTIPVPSLFLVPTKQLQPQQLRPQQQQQQWHGQGSPATNYEQEQGRNRAATEEGEEEKNPNRVQSSQTTTRGNTKKASNRKRRWGRTTEKQDLLLSGDHVSTTGQKNKKQKKTRPAVSCYKQEDVERVETKMMIKKNNINEQNPRLDQSRPQLAAQAKLQDEVVAVQQVQPQPQPGEFDVLCGRGTGPNQHIGNRRYLLKVLELRSKYRQCVGGEAAAATTVSVEGNDDDDGTSTTHTITEKDRIALEVIDYVEQQGGRFVQRDETTRKLLTYPRKATLDKVKAALRGSHIPHFVRDHFIYNNQRRHQSSKAPTVAR